MTGGSRWWLWRETAGVFGVLLLLLLVRWPGCASGLTTFHAEDYWVLNLPVRAYLGASLAAGQMVWWTPLLQGGYPLFAESQLGGAYPLRLLHALPLAPWQVLAWTILLHLAWAGAGAYAWLRLRGVRAAAGWVGAVAMAFAPALVVRHQHTNVLEAMAWWPWLLVGCELAMRDRTVRGSLPLAVAASLLALCGHVQYVILGGLLAVLYSGWRLGEVARQERRRAAGAVLVGLALAGVGAAVQYLPLAELVGHSLRADGLAAGEGVAGLRPQHLPLFFAPPFWGPPFAVSQPSLLWEFIAAPGMCCLVLAVVAVRRRVPGAGFLAVVAVVAVWGALGDAFGLSRLLAWVPGLGAMRAPSRLLGWLAVALPLLAGLGAEAALVTPLRWAGSRAIVLISAALPLLVTGTALAAVRIVPEAGAWPLASLSLVAVAWVALLGWSRSGGGERQRGLVMSGLVVVELVLIGWTLAPTRPVDEELRQPTAGPARMAVGPGRDAVLFWFQPNTCLLIGQANVHTMSPLGLRRPVALLEAAEVADERPPDDPGSAKARVLAMYGADTVGLVEDGVARLARLPLAPLPAVWPVGRVASLDQPSARHNYLLDPTFDPREVAVVAGGTLAGLSGSGALARATIDFDSRHRLALTANTARDGFWVLNRTAYPGWQLTVDGEPATLHLTNEIHTGVATFGPGPHRIRLVYRPLSIRFGLYLSLLAVAAAGGIAVGGRRR